MNWRFKGCTQKFLSSAPGGTEVNDFLQRTLGGLRHFEQTVHSKVSDWIGLTSYMRELGRSPDGLRFVEIGTGWLPTLPICFRLAGATDCATFDLKRHLSKKLTLRMILALEKHLVDIAATSNRTVAQVHAQYDCVRQADSLNDLLHRANIYYHAPADASATGLPPDSVDVVFSNSVLEHVPADAIRRLMQETVRILRSGGLAIHGVNCGDHYAYFDRQITAINYLRYSKEQWQFWNNNLQYQNRLRPCDFLEVAEAAGLRITLRKYKPRQDLFEALPCLKIARDFQKYPPEELCCTSADFIAQKP
jgi:SAM-dependent methyltransferase